MLRIILGSHAKAPIEQLYLKTASISLTDSIIIRRLIYLQTILQKPEGELIRDIYETMKKDPVPNDWCLLVQKDIAELNLNYTDQDIRNMDQTLYKSTIKERVRNYSYIYFKNYKPTMKRETRSHISTADTPKSI